MANRARRSLLRRAVVVVAVAVGVPGAVLAAMIVIGAPEPPPPMSSVIEGASAARDGAPAPQPRRFTARDGESLAYRFYPAEGEGPAETVAIVIHGSGGNALAMNRLAHGLARAGVAVYAPDVRGHGGSGTRGDIDVVGRLEEDLVDLLTTVVMERHGDARMVLAGHSSGGGFVLRMATEDVGRTFARFVLLAPYLGHDAPTTRDDGGWADAGVPRIIALSVLDRLGITWFHHLPVLAFALPPAGEGPDDGLTRTWSYALWRDFGPGANPVADARSAYGQVEIVVGAEDEIMVADRYEALFAPAGSDVSVTVLPGLDHVGVIVEERGIDAVVRAMSGG